MARAIEALHLTMSYAIAKMLNSEGIRTRHGKLFDTTRIQRIFHPGDLQSMYFLDRESDNVWRYYSIVRTGKNASGLIAGNESSSANRAVAFYRHLVGIPTAQEPPGAR